MNTVKSAIAEGIVQGLGEFYTICVRTVLVTTVAIYTARFLGVSI